MSYIRRKCKEKRSWKLIKCCNMAVGIVVKEETVGEADDKADDLERYIHGGTGVTAFCYDV